MKRFQREQINTPEGLLVRIKNKICIELGIDPGRLKVLIDKFVVRAFNGVENSKAHYDKVNHYNDFTKNTMTIKVFFKFLRTIRIKKMKITVEVTTERDVVATVSEEVYFTSMEPEAPPKSELDPGPGLLRPEGQVIDRAVYSDLYNAVAGDQQKPKEPEHEG